MYLLNLVPTCPLLLRSQKLLYTLEPMPIEIDCFRLLLSEESEQSKKLLHWRYCIKKRLPLPKTASLSTPSSRTPPNDRLTPSRQQNSTSSKAAWKSRTASSKRFCEANGVKNVGKVNSINVYNFTIYVHIMSTCKPLQTEQCIAVLDVKNMFPKSNNQNGNL